MLYDHFLDTDIYVDILKDRKYIDKHCKGNLDYNNRNSLRRWLRGVLW